MSGNSRSNASKNDLNKSGSKPFCLAEQLAEYMLSCLAEIERVYEDNHEEITYRNGEIEDLQHEIELADIRGRRGHYLARELKRARMARRQAKDENETMFYLYDLVRKNPGFKNALINALKDIRRRQQEQGNRIYKPRVRNDLTIAAGCGDGAGAGSGYGSYGNGVEGYEEEGGAEDENYRD